MIKRVRSKAGRPRIDDVAAMAQTSPITVSRTLREPSLVAEPTRLRVLAAVDALGYVPNFSASNLASRRSNIVTLLVPSASSPIFPETFRGVADSLAGTGLQLLLGDYGYPQSREGRLLQTVLALSPEAIVVIGVIEEGRLRQTLRDLAMPVVETWEAVPDPIDLAVGFSNTQAGIAMGRHLVERGYRRIAYAGPDVPRSQRRLDGLAQVLRDAGLPPPVFALAPAQGSALQGAAVLGQILDSTPDIEAIFFSSDMLAIGAVLEAQRRGIAIPQRLAISGLGGIELAEQLHPGLTTIAVPAYEMGRRAGLLVRARLDGTAVRQPTIDLGFTLIERETT